MCTEEFRRPLQDLASDAPHYGYDGIRSPNKMDLCKTFYFFTNVCLLSAFFLHCKRILLCPFVWLGYCLGWSLVCRSMQMSTFAPSLRKHELVFIVSIKGSADCDYK